MSRQLTSFVQAKSLNIADVSSSDGAASTNTVAVSTWRRASFLVDVGIPSAMTGSDWTSDATLAVSIQHSLLDVASDWAVGVATDISASAPPTTGDVTFALNVASDIAGPTVAGGLYWIDMNLNALGITSGLLRAYIQPSSDFAVPPSDLAISVIALMYDRDGGVPSNSNVTSIVQAYST